jgi:uncharacterized protein (TIGR03067 family)
MCGLVGAAGYLVFMLGGVPLRGDPAKQGEQDRIARLIKQLGDDRFATREAASRELVAIGKPALPALRRAAASSDDPEMRRRAEQIVRDVTHRIFAVAAKNELATWEGIWEERGGTTLFIKGDRWSWTTKGMKPTYRNIIRIVQVQERMTLADLLVGEPGPSNGRTVKAIFRLDGDTLHYCGTYDLPRPTAFVKGGRDPYYFEWKRVKK